MSDGRAGEKWIEVASFADLVEARTVAGALEAAGIEVQIVNTAIVGMLPHLSSAFGGVAVSVRSEDAEGAREILATSASVPAAEAEAPLGDGSLPAEAEAPLAADDEPIRDGPRLVFARRAVAAAVLGFVLLPGVLHLVSVWNLVRFARAPGPTSRRARHMAWAAGFMNALFVLIIGLLVTSAVTPDRPEPPPRYQVIPISGPAPRPP